MSPAPEPRPGLRDVAPYDSPQIPVVASLNTNECPLPLPEAFSDDLAETVRAIELHRYPDGQMTALRTAIADATDHVAGPGGVWVANGSNEILTELLLAYGGPGRRVVTFEPTYLLHSRLAWLTHTEVAAVTLEPPFRLDAEVIDRALAAEPDVILVCSPNNPTGNGQDPEQVAELARRTQALVVVDEAYIEFGGRSALPLVAAEPNVAVVRTFSKAFALAGARLGYVLTTPVVVDDLQRVRLPYHVSSLTLAAGLTALRHTPEALERLDAIREQRDRIVTELGAIEGLSVFASDANFVLFVPPMPAAQVWQRLLDRGVLVRDLSSVVPGALRVTAGTKTEVDLFLTSLQEVLAA
jgi:histidinol-phosphate aminotransferase